MISKIKKFVINHYLVVAYSIIALSFVLAVLFSENLQFLIHMLASLVVITIYAAVGGLSYIVIRALIADHCVDKKSIKIIGLLVLILAVLYPVLKYGMKIEDLNHLYLLAPIASWPAILAVLILNIITKWGDRREKRKQSKQ